MSFETEQPTQEAPVKRIVPKAPPAPTAKAAPEDKLMVISEGAVNQLLTAISQLKGLDWATTNPLMVFIQQNVKPLPTTPVTD